MAVTIDCVTDVQQIGEGIRVFNHGARQHKERARSLLHHTRFWVFDPDTRRFGPGKFVGFAAMNYATYEAGKAGQTCKSKFNGGTARLAIEEVLASTFQPDAELGTRLVEWGTQLLGEGVFDGVASEKWRFVSLQHAPGPITTAMNKVCDELDERGRDLASAAAPRILRQERW